MKEEDNINGATGLEKEGKYKERLLL